MKKLTNNGFSTQKGFTLIELVVVIVILGILAATAAPKFIDLTGDARASVMKGVEGSINSAINLAHAKALVKSEIGENGVITIGTTPYALAFGYPVAAATTTAPIGENVSGLVELGSSEVTYDETSKKFIHTGSPLNTPDTATCFITYTDAVDANTPAVVTATLVDC